MNYFIHHALQIFGKLEAIGTDEDSVKTSLDGWYEVKANCDTCVWLGQSIVFGIESLSFVLFCLVGRQLFFLVLLLAKLISPYARW